MTSKKGDKQMQTLKPVGDRVAIRIDAIKEETDSGIVLAPSNQEKQNTGEVVSVGLEVEDINVGDRVLFPEYAGTTLVYNEEQLLIINAKECLAVLKEKQ